MQEEVESKMVTLSVNTTKLTARTLKQALEKFLAHQRNKAAQHSQNKDVIPHGKQTVKQLAAQNQGLTNIEITDKNIKDFDRVARKYGVDYAVKKDKTVIPPKYLVTTTQTPESSSRFITSSTGIPAVPEGSPSSEKRAISVPVKI